MSGDPSAIVVDAEVVALDAHRSAIHAALVRLRVQVAGVEHRAPTCLAPVQIVREKLRGSLPDEILQRNPVLPGVRFVCNRHALVLKDVFEQRVLVSRVVPLDGLIEHHDEKPIDRLREKKLAEAIGGNGQGNPRRVSVRTYVPRRPVGRCPT